LARPVAVARAETHAQTHILPRKNETATASFLLSLDYLLADACHVAVRPFASACSTVPANPITLIPICTPTLVPAEGLPTSTPSASKASRARTSREAFDHDAVATFLAHGTWNDLAPQGGGVTFAVPDDAALRAATLGPAPFAQAEEPTSTSSRVACVACDEALTCLSAESAFRPMDQPPAKKRPRALSLDDADADSAFDGAAVARFLAAGSWNDWALPPGPAADRALMQAARTLGLALPFVADLPPAAPGLQRRESDRAASSATAASSWATVDATAKEPSSPKTPRTRAVEEADADAAANMANAEVDAAAEVAPIAGLAPAYQKRNDARGALRGEFGGSSSGCVASAFTSVLTCA
jgi:hypothetical protein